VEETEVFVMNIRKASTAFTLAGIAAVLLVAYVIALGNVKLKSYERALDAGIWDFSAEDITRISIVERGGADALIFDKRNGKWILMHPKSLDCEQSIADALPLTLVALRAEKIIARGEFERFGLDDPVAVRIRTITSGNSGHVHSHGDTTNAPATETWHELLIGDENSDGSARYFSVNGLVYTMDAATATALALDSLNVRDKNVLGFNRTLRPGDIAARISNIRMNGKDRPELADTLARLNAAEFIGAVDFAAKHTIEFDYDGEARVLYIGESADDVYYAKTPDSDIIFTVLRRGLEDL
jgi:hypothetical protein